MSALDRFRSRAAAHPHRQAGEAPSARPLLAEDHGEDLTSTGKNALEIVIPHCASAQWGRRGSREPGIHNHEPGLWIPGLRLAAHPGMTRLMESSALDEGEQVGVDGLGFRGWHAVRKSL